MRMDVTDIVKNWLSGSIVNDGFMIKRSGSIGNNNPSASEGSTERLGSFSFFSSNSNYCQINFSYKNLIQILLWLQHKSQYIKITNRR